MLARNLRAGGFAGRVMLVNPKHAAVDGEPCHPDVASLPETPDLAVIATPPDAVPASSPRSAPAAPRRRWSSPPASARCRRPRPALRQAMLDAARPHLLRIVGPNCLGIMVPGRGLNATFAHLGAQSGKLAFVTQSGAVLAGVLDWASARDIGFSHLVSVGDMADVDFGDLLDYLALDPATSAILLYVEAVTHARKFMSAARRRPASSRWSSSRPGATRRARAAASRRARRRRRRSTRRPSGAPACSACGRCRSCSTPSRSWRGARRWPATASRS